MSNTTLSVPCWTGDHDADRCIRSRAYGDRCDCPCHAEPPARPAEQPHTAPAAAGPHPDTVELPEAPCDDPGCRCCYPMGVHPALTAAGPHPDTPDGAAGAELDLDAIADGATGWDRDWIACLPGHLPSSTYLAPDLAGRAGREIAALLADVDRLTAEVRRLRSVAVIRDDFDQYGPSEWDPEVIQRLIDNLDELDDEHRQPGGRCRSATGDHLRALVAEVRRLRGLVSPAAGRVLDAVGRWWEAAKRQGVYAEHVAALVAAWDALDGDQPAEPGPAQVRCGCGERIVHATPDGYGRDGCDDPDPDGQIERLNQAVADAEQRADAAEDRMVTASAERQWAVDGLCRSCGYGLSAPESAVARAMDTEPDPDDEAEMDADIAEFAALPDCRHCGGTGKQVPEGWYERRREAERYARRVLGPAVERYLRDAEPAPESVGEPEAVHIEQLTDSEIEGAVNAAMVGDRDAMDRVLRHAVDRLRAEPAPEPDSGPEWHREGVADASGRLPADLAAQVDGLLGDWARQVAVSRERGRELKRVTSDLSRTEDELAEVTTDRDRRYSDTVRVTYERDAARRQRDAARAELAEVTADRDRLRDAYNEYGEQVAELRGIVAARTHERDSARAIAKDVIDEQSAHEGELGDMRSQLSAAEAEVDRLRGELTTARRDAAADTLEEAAGGDMTDLRRWAAEIRAGTRPVPGSPQPAEGGGDDGE